MRVLGVDPGTRITGYGLVDSAGGELRHVGHGVVRTDPAQPLWVRLKVIHDGIAGVVGEFGPEQVSIERCFVAKNVRSALMLGHARGAVMVACMCGGVDVHEYAPSEIKSAVTGHGRADKHQVAEMVRVILGLARSAPADASDALAAAICHAHASPRRAP